MPKDVKKALIDIIIGEGRLSEEEASKLIQSKVAKREYIVDAW